ncbi:MAG TPA: peptidylprolyl isomerase [Casimicrobiaceae bacterium]|jgi:peptidyl-prolyl cis-trans isomerase C|nr:peptidylprolyl isomerase [Casimicrobiaceae bacterium]
MFRSKTLLAALAASMLAWQGIAIAQTPTQAPALAPAATQHPPDEVLAENAQTRLTRADYDADIQRLPADMRDAFASDPRRLSAYLTNLLIVKTLAAEARKAGLENDPVLQRRVALEVDRALADMQLRRVEDAAGKEFDAKSGEYLVRAKEIYLVEKDKHRTPEQINASQILFDLKHHTPEEALALAQETRKKLIAGADFNATAKELSDDPTAKTNGGEIGWFTRERMDPSFSQAAFDMKTVGEISEPIKSRFGYHLIRLEGRREAEVRPFEAVQPRIMADLRKRYVEAQRDAATTAIRIDPALKVNQPAVDALVYQPDPEIFSSGKRGSVGPIRGDRDKKGAIAPQ